MKFPLVKAILIILPHWIFATKELDSKSFVEMTKSGKNGMIKFFQPWCGHCTRMKPDWDKLAEEAHPSVFIADVNCSDQPDLCKENDVSGYPTIKVYKDGEVTQYSGGRGFDQLADYVDKELAMKCDITKATESCSEKAVDYIAKWKGKDAAAVEQELKRLSSLSKKSMESHLKGTFFSHILRCGRCVELNRATLTRNDFAIGKPG